MNQEKTNILLVDDRPANLLALESVLTEIGQNVVTAHSGAEALWRVTELDFAVILLDVNMPNMDGYETAALIRSRQKSAHTPIIFVTAYTDEVHTAHGYNLGAVDFILTPVVPEILRTKVKVFVDLFQMTQQIKRQAAEQVVLAREHAARAAAEETVQRLNFLAEASKTLANSLDLEATIRALLGLVVPRQADVAMVTLLIDQEQLGPTEVAWLDASGGLCTRKLADPETLHPAIAESLQRVIARGTPECLPALGGHPPALFHLQEAFPGNSQPDRVWESITVLPLVARGRALGALSLALDGARYAAAGQPPSLVDLSSVEELVHRAAIAIDNAQLYRNIQTADRRKNEFLSMLAHELRNPLAPLLNGINILRLHGPKQPDIQKIQDMMNRQVSHLVRLVDDLLDISRITCDKIQLQIETVEVATVVERAVEVSRPLLDACGHELTITMPPQPIPVNADPIRLAQVLSNLLNNAAKYTEKGGKVALSVTLENSEVVFRVRDNGMGIPKEWLACIFDLFTQVDRSLDRSHGGLGIGLTLVRRLVEMHGGSVWAHSDGPGHGSEFVVRLPRLTGRQPGPALDTEAPILPNAGLRRVLVVDDNVDVADSTAMLLRHIGLTVLVSHDGPTALSAARTFRPELVLLDIGLPGMDGYEVARRLREQSDLEPMILVALSGYGQEEDRQRSREADFDNHLVKPATLADLRALVMNS